MKALVLDAEHAFPELREVPEPSAGPGEVAIKVTAAGLNYADTMLRRGFYLSKPEFPYVPGFELAGEILNGPRAGTRVMAIGQKAFAERAVIAEAASWLVPEGFSDEEAAAFLVTYLTAFGMLRISARAQAAESILVHAAAGGVGTATIQLAKHLGLRVIASASSAEKLALARKLGADVTINYTTEDFVERVLAETGGRGADIIFESIGGEFVAKNIQAAAPFGRIVVFGLAGGEAANPDIASMYKNSVTVSAFWLITLLSDPVRLNQVASDLLSLVTPAALRPVVGRVYPLADGTQAFRDLESRKSIGKLVLRP